MDFTWRKENGFFFGFVFAIVGFFTWKIFIFFLRTTKWSFNYRNSVKFWFFIGYILRPDLYFLLLCWWLHFVLFKWEMPNFKKKEIFFGFVFAIVGLFSWIIFHFVFERKMKLSFNYKNSVEILIPAWVKYWEFLGWNVGLIANGVRTCGYDALVGSIEGLVFSVLYSINSYFAFFGLSPKKLFMNVWITCQSFQSNQ